MLACNLRAWVDSSGKTYQQLADELHWSETRIADFIRLNAIPGTDFIEDLARVTLPEATRDEERCHTESLLRSVTRSVTTLPAPVPPNIRPSQADPDASRALWEQLDRTLRRWNDAENVYISVETARILVCGARADAERHISRLAAECDHLKTVLGQTHAQAELVQRHQARIRDLVREIGQIRYYMTEASKQIQELEDVISAAKSAAAAALARVKELEWDLALYGDVNVARQVHEPSIQTAPGTAWEVLDHANAVRAEARNNLRRITEEEAEEPPSFKSAKPVEYSEEEVHEQLGELFREIARLRKMTGGPRTTVLSRDMNEAWTQMRRAAVYHELTLAMESIVKLQVALRKGHMRAARKRVGKVKKRLESIVRLDTSMNHPDILGPYGVQAQMLLNNLQGVRQITS
ncbi:MULTISPECIES: hypothetical protein [Streptomyces]|uniref:hypothetical protein n=1 Tax=Streptomyces TaxID=1883 RepID=UPI002FF15458